MSDLRNLIITIILSTAILVGWQYFYERPSHNQAKINYSNNSKAISPEEKPLMKRKEALIKSKHHRLKN